MLAFSRGAFDCSVDGRTGCRSSHEAVIIYGLGMHCCLDRAYARQRLQGQRLCPDMEHRLSTVKLHCRVPSVLTSSRCPRPIFFCRAMYKETPLCPQCKHTFHYLYVHRQLDGTVTDYAAEESVCLLKRATWFTRHLEVRPGGDKGVAGLGGTG